MSQHNDQDLQYHEKHPNLLLHLSGGHFFTLLLQIQNPLILLHLLYIQSVLILVHHLTLYWVLLLEVANEGAGIMSRSLSCNNNL